jgi:hypothetical protein
MLLEWAASLFHAGQTCCSLTLKHTHARPFSRALSLCLSDALCVCLSQVAVEMDSDRKTLACFCEFFCLRSAIQAAEKLDTRVLLPSDINGRLTST